MRVGIEFSVKRAIIFYIVFQTIYAINDTIYFKEKLDYFLRVWIGNFLNPFTVLTRFFSVVKQLNILSFLTYLIIFSISFISFISIKSKRRSTYPKYS